MRFYFPRSSFFHRPYYRSESRAGFCTASYHVFSTSSRLTVTATTERNRFQFQCVTSCRRGRPGPYSIFLLAVPAFFCQGRDASGNEHFQACTWYSSCMALRYCRPHSLPLTLCRFEGLSLPTTVSDALIQARECLAAMVQIGMV